MSKNITLITSSLHKISNSEILANEFVRGAKENGNKVEVINLKNFKLNYCVGCLSCQKTHKCVIKDDMTPKVIETLRTSDVLVFVTPVYYYAMSGQMKTFIDRMNPLYNMDFKYRDIFIISTAVENDINAFKRVKTEVKGFSECFEGTRIKGGVYAGGMENVGDAKKSKKYLKEAYELGKKIK